MTAHDAKHMLEVAFDDLIPKLKTTADVSKRAELPEVLEHVEMAQLALEQAKTILESNPPAKGVTNQERG